MTFLEAPVRWWKCPNCDVVDRTQRPDVHTQFHDCRALGVTIPLIEVSDPEARPDGRQVVVEREDYLGAENADPMMAVRTERGDGSNDCTVFAPTARINLDGGN